MSSFFQVVYGSCDKNHARRNRQIIFIRFRVRLICFCVIQLCVACCRCSKRMGGRDGQRRFSGRITLVKRISQYDSQQTRKRYRCGVRIRVRGLIRV